MSNTTAGGEFISPIALLKSFCKEYESISFSIFRTCFLKEISSPINTVEGLKWGQYVGSPALGAPAVGFSQTLNASVQSLVCLKNDIVFVLSHNSTLMTVHQAKPGESEGRLLWSAVLSWGYMDGCIRVCTSPDSVPVCLMEHHTPDKVNEPGRFLLID